MVRQLGSDSYRKVVSGRLHAASERMTRDSYGDRRACAPRPSRAVVAEGPQVESARHLQEPPYLKAQLWQISFNNAPDDLVGDSGICVDQAVAESNDSARADT